MVELVAPTEARVEINTEEEINRRIRRELEACVYHYAQHPDEIDDRLRELEQEWNIERILEANAGAFTVLGLILGTGNRGWFILPGLVAAFLLQHAIQGWCPPVSVLRRLGVRTLREINHERFALKALQGDFDNVHAEGTSPEEQAGRAIEAAERRL